MSCHRWALFSIRRAMPCTVTVAYAVASLENRARRSGLRFWRIAFTKPSRSSTFLRFLQASTCPPPRSRFTANQRSGQRAWFTRVTAYPVLAHSWPTCRLQPTRSSNRGARRIPNCPHHVGLHHGSVSPDPHRRPYRSVARASPEHLLCPTGIWRLRAAIGGAVGDWQHLPAPAPTASAMRGLWNPSPRADLCFEYFSNLTTIC